MMPRALVGPAPSPLGRPPGGPAYTAHPMPPSPESVAGAGSAAALSAPAVVGGVSLHRRAAAFGLSAALVASAGQSFFIGLFGAAVQAGRVLFGGQGRQAGAG
jgi:hypothetical protein